MQTIQLTAVHILSTIESYIYIYIHTHIYLLITLSVVIHAYFTLRLEYFTIFLLTIAQLLMIFV